MHRPTLRRSLCSWIAVLSLLAACSDDPAGDASQDASDDVASDAAGDTDASLADGDLSDSSDVGDDTEGPDAADADDTAPDSGDDGLAVGSACTDDAQCSGASPWCIDGQLAPLAALESSQSTAAASLASLGVVPFPEGYFSNVAPCTADADCGTGGTCFQPLIDVDADAFAGIVGALALEPGGDEEALVLGFREYGQCLYACETDADCARPGYTCDVPLGDFLAITSTIGGRLETYCVGEAIDQCEALTCEQGECVVGPEGIATCDCDTGWSGDACDVPFDCGAPEAVDPPLSVATDDGTTLDAVATYVTEDVQVAPLRPQPLATIREGTDFRVQRADPSTDAPRGTSWSARPSAPAALLAGRATFRPAAPSRRRATRRPVVRTAPATTPRAPSSAPATRGTAATPARPSSIAAIRARSTHPCRSICQAAPRSAPSPGMPAAKGSSSKATPRARVPSTGGAAPSRRARP